MVGLKFGKHLFFFFSRELVNILLLNLREVSSTSSCFNSFVFLPYCGCRKRKETSKITDFLARSICFFFFFFLSAFHWAHNIGASFGMAKAHLSPTIYMFVYLLTTSQ